MLRALAEFELVGVKSLLGFHQALLSHPCFVAAATCRDVVDSAELAQATEQFSHPATTVAATPDGALSVQTNITEDDGRRVQVRKLRPELTYRSLAKRRPERTARARRRHGPC